MSSRQDQEREARLQPIRVQTAISAIAARGYTVTQNSATEIYFDFKGERIRFFPYSGWATGKTITDGRGLDNLLKQI